MKAATEYFTSRRWSPSRSSTAPYDLAILYDPEDKEPPSDERAIKKFMKAARAFGLEPEIVDRDDYARLGEYDALFIRETTNVNHHTYRFARRAQAEGLVVIDDPESIVRCTNKIYLAELMTRHSVRIRGRWWCSARASNESSPSSGFLASSSSPTAHSPRAW